MKYNKSPKHIKCLYAIQKSQIKWDRLKEDVFFSRKEHLINYWWHSWISQDFSPLGRRVIWFTSKKLAFICSRTSPLKHYVFNNVIMLQLQKVFSLKKEKGGFSLCFFTLLWHNKAGLKRFLYNLFISCPQNQLLKFDKLWI